ncbi:hypothetical protein GV054_09870 [Marinomonas mediterranea]|jgi:hypothetical protein|uniref:Lipoprotein n=1 Tax=Marinomonas mediterranea (strain ATCC 700492 / JCM 21426 / NBRC 103028 / MMB-1) TaxID=717774 RepID=F2K2U9_MARM1|nr:hypothetical protein [Marinomonas mediterranea]ADZ91232.1 hypothetical protein Marme_1984 [Marinomonas mediterranea MMB-1]WCN13290.1 hypothetical protein GV054_09870 [Marinomonas mediterranea]WCN17358.1 hypothetical protein GV053_10000 [Marinomonas mediterranea MMB-1]
MNLSKQKVLFVSAAFSLTLLSGCSVLPDHGLDYQSSQASSKKLALPEGSEQPIDKLQIPNESRIASYSEPSEFEAPRAPFVYSQMANIVLSEQESTAVFSVPAPVTTTKRLVLNYLNARYGDEKAVEGEIDGVITTTPRSIREVSTLKRFWSKVTRLPLDTVVWKYALSDDLIAGQTRVSVSVRFKKGEEFEGDWQSPFADLDTGEQALAFWRSLGQNLDTSSVILSERENKELRPYSIWSALNGSLALYLGSGIQAAQLKEKIESNPKLFIDNNGQMLSVVPPEQIAKVGDIVPFSSSLLGEDAQVKWFNVRRKDLDDVTWQEREYPFKLVQQPSGVLLEVDSSAAKHPLLVSYRLLTLLSEK